MAYREKMAWVMLGTFILAYGAYFFLVIGAESRGPVSTLYYLLLLFEIIAVQVFLIGVAGFVIAARNRAEYRAPADERDRAIRFRSAEAAYYVLVTGMILVGVIMPFSERGWTVTNAALLAIVLAEIVRQVVVILGYRRGWHG